MSLVHEASEAAGSVRRHEHGQTSHQQTLDLHSVTLTELKLVRRGRVVVGDRDTGTRH